MRHPTKFTPLHRLLHDCYSDDLSIVSRLSGQIQSLIKYIEESQAKRVFIYSHDRHFFLSAMLAAFQVGVETVLPHTNAPEFLSNVIENSDVLLTEAIVLPAKK